VPEREPPGRRVTKWLVPVTVVVWILWDVWVYFREGGASTESTFIGQCLAYSPWLALLIGVLVGHLLASVPPDATHNVLRWLMLAVGLVAGWFCTRGG